MHLSILSKDLCLRTETQAIEWIDMCRLKVAKKTQSKGTKPGVSRIGHLAPLGHVRYRTATAMCFSGTDKV